MARLSAYRAKRHFDRTPEPRGKPACRAGAGRFVVQRHRARRLHFDFRLEINGVFKSWAVTKVPSLDPSVRRLAIEVEDHPLEYGVFEGVIPKGEYGAGAVQLWDRGDWRSQTGNRPGYDFGKGVLKFVLHGRKLKGGWALIRVGARSGDARKSWLLVKERDREAKRGSPDRLARFARSVKTGRTLAEIVRGRKRMRR